MSLKQPVNNSWCQTIGYCGH